MATTTNKRNITVGIFVLLGVIILITGIFVLGGKQKRFVKTVRAIAIFKDVSGLKAGNNVWFSGVKVGTVKGVHFYGNSQVEVDMNIEASSQQYIRKNAGATISSDGLIGNKIVEIFGGSTAAAPIEDNDRLQTREAMSSDQLMATLQENNQNLLRVTTDFKDIVSQIKQGKGTAGAILTDPALANTFRATMTNLQRASEHTNSMSGSIAQFAAKLNAKGGLANELVTDTTVIRRLRVASARLEQASATANTITANLNQATQKLNSSSSPLGVLLNDAETANILKSSLKNLNRGTTLLNEDLEAAQHNFLLRGFFKKKAKEQGKQGEANSTAIVDTVAKQ